MGLTTITALTGIYIWQVEPFGLEFVEMDMPIRNLPTHLHNKTFMQISDIHVGFRFDYHFLCVGVKVR